MGRFEMKDIQVSSSKAALHSEGPRSVFADLGYSHGKLGRWPETSGPK